MKCGFLATGFMACAAVAVAQQPTQLTFLRTTVGAMGPSGTARFSPPMFQPAVVVGAPYSAEQVSEHVQTLADGTHITRKNSSTKMYRDSQGRTRTERPIAAPMALPNQPVAPNVVEIQDAVAGVTYTLDIVNKVAHRTHVQARGAAAVRTGAFQAAIVPPPPPPPPPPPAQISGVAAGIEGGVGFGFSGTAAAPARPAINQEQLGQQTIEGVLVEGRRITQTYALDAIGNDRPITVVSETWTSPALKLTVLNSTDDPRSGKTTTKLVNVSQGEPAADLFQPPPDYKIVDETGDFSISWGPAPPQ